MPRSAFAVSQIGTATLRALNFAPEVEAFRGKQRRNRSSRRLADLVADFGLAYRKIFTRHDCARGTGDELLSQGEMFAAEPEGRWIRGDQIRNVEENRIRPWQVLIAGVGTLGENELFGRSIIADDRLAGSIVGPDSVVLEFKDPGGRENRFAYAFLATRIGVRAVRCTAYGTKMLGLRLDLLRDLPVPWPDEEIVDRVAKLIGIAVEARAKFATELSAGRKLVEDLGPMRSAVAMCRERRARCLVWDGSLPTFNAWNFGSTGGAQACLQSAWSTRLGDVLDGDGVFNGPRFARIPCHAPYGVEFVSQGDAFLIRHSGRRIVRPAFNDKLLYVRAGTVLVGGHGTLGEGEIFGKTIFVSEDLARCALTQDLLRVQTKPEHSTLAYAYLSTLVGLRLLRSTAVGTKILSMRPDLLRALPFPDVDSRFRDRVSRHVEAAMRARTEANRAESEAVRILEQEVLPAWLA